MPKAQRRIDGTARARCIWRTRRDAYARTLSGGMKRRLLVAKAMVHSPPVLVLDEPTAGVDVELRQQLWAYVRELNADGVTVVLTTHYLEEAEQLCDRIAIINHGQLIANKPTRELVGMAQEKVVEVTVDRDVADAAAGGLLRARSSCKGRADARRSPTARTASTPAKCSPRCSRDGLRHRRRVDPRGRSGGRVPQPDQRQAGDRRSHDAPSRSCQRSAWPIDCRTLERDARDALPDRRSVRRPHRRLGRRRADRGAHPGRPLPGAVLAKGALTEGSTAWAQGGIAAVLEPGDTFESHIEDTMIAGAGLNDRETVEFVIEHAPAAIERLRELGVPFNEEGGALHLTREGGHSHRRIVHVDDATGWAVQEALLKAAEAHPNITLLPDQVVHRPDHRPP